MAAGSSDSIEADAETVFEYHKMAMQLQRPVDAVFCLCSLDVRVARRAAELFLEGYGDRLIFSGGVGRLTEGRFAKPEAEVFADIAREMGVPAEKLVVENRSTNTGENVRFVWDLLQQSELAVRSFVLVQKPYMERRTYATFKKQWPNPETAITVTSPQLAWADYPDANNPRGLVTNIMVGDLIRIREYPAKGFQIHQDIPDDVWEAGQRLIKAGYNSHLP
ncbi:glycosyl hydrolase family 3 N terminal domain-containing protein [Apiospora marii]|uniref:Glycosyl hydrolase family 3 N terminal domain-containing protein n=1 Tax=Apiospora marii TaxID=335849 RepID=A0ABR1RDX6_9PEZI